MTYNFQDEPTPRLPSQIDTSGGVTLQNGTPQGNLITTAFPGRNVSISVLPPRGWALDSVVWPNGGGGTFSIPAPGVEETHPFIYTVSQSGQSLTGSGHFKIKKQGDGGG